MHQPPRPPSSSAPLPSSRNTSPCNPGHFLRLFGFTGHVLLSSQMTDTGLTATLPVSRVREDYLESFREVQESPRPHELDQVREGDRETEKMACRELGGGEKPGTAVRHTEPQRPNTGLWLPTAKAANTTEQEEEISHGRDTPEFRARVFTRAKRVNRAPVRSSFRPFRRALGPRRDRALALHTRSRASIAVCAQVAAFTETVRRAQERGSDTVLRMACGLQELMRGGGGEEEALERIQDFLDDFYQVSDWV